VGGDLGVLLRELAVLLGELGRLLGELVHRSVQVLQHLRRMPVRLAY
jgi:hypothetical protein